MNATNTILIAAVALAASACLALLINPSRRKFLQKKEYDIQDENPWDDLMKTEEEKNQTKKKRK